MLRRLLAVLAGLVAGQIPVLAADAAAGSLMPPELKTGGMEALKAALASGQFPLTPLVVMSVGWMLAGAVAGYVGSRVGRAALPGFIAGALQLAGTVFNLTQLPHPAWMWVPGTAGVAAMAFLGARLGSRNS